jgi:hypothetical protein
MNLIRLDNWSGITDSDAPLASASLDSTLECENVVIADNTCQDIRPFRKAVSPGSPQMLSLRLHAGTLA